MPKKKNKTGHKHRRLFLFKEVALASFAVASVGVVLFDLVKPPTPAQQRILAYTEFSIACIFLIDFFAELILAKDRKKYFRHNWYLLLASIPLTYSAVEALRGLRVLRLLRVVRAGEHLNVGFKQI